MDTNLVIRNGGSNLTADETVASVAFLAQRKPLYLVTNLPGFVAANSLVIKANFLDASDNVLQTTSSKSIAAKGLYALPLFCDDPLCAKLQIVFDVTGGTANFGAAKSWISPARL